MKIDRKDATIANTGPDDDFPGAFEVILSAPTLDRDGDTYLPDEWKQPLPDHITFDSDHGMSVATTVGSGVPSIDDKGNLVVSGTYSSLPRAQEVRTLVNEGHIRTTSVASMQIKDTKAAGGTVRELLNGAFVAVPSNREALVLSSKGLADRTKAGARNSSSDADLIQQIHDAALALGAEPAAAAEKQASRAAHKSIVGSVEALKDRVREALQAANGGVWVWIRGTIPGTDGAGTVVFEVENPVTYDTELYQQSYTDDGQTTILQGDRTTVGVAEIVTPDPEQGSTASTSPDGTTKSPAAGAPAPAAGDDEAPSGDTAAAEIKVRMAHIAAMQRIANPEGD